VKHETRVHNTKELIASISINACPTNFGKWKSISTL